MPFAFNTCVGCYRTWSPTDERKGKEWWPLRDQDIQRWCCYRCINRLWRQSAAAPRPGYYSDKCYVSVDEILQTAEFQHDLRNLLEMHKREYSTEQEREPWVKPECEPSGPSVMDGECEPSGPSVMDDDSMDVDVD